MSDETDSRAADPTHSGVSRGDVPLMYCGAAAKFAAAALLFTMIALPFLDHASSQFRIGIMDGFVGLIIGAVAGRQAFRLLVPRIEHAFAGTDGSMMTLRGRADYWQAQFVIMLFFFIVGLTSAFAIFAVCNWLGIRYPLCGFPSMGFVSYWVTLLYSYGNWYSRLPE